MEVRWDLWRLCLDSWRDFRLGWDSRKEMKGCFSDPSDGESVVTTSPIHNLLRFFHLAPASLYTSTTSAGWGKLVVIVSSSRVGMELTTIFRRWGRIGGPAG